MATVTTEKKKIDALNITRESIFVSLFVGKQSQSSFQRFYRAICSYLNTNISRATIANTLYKSIIDYAQLDMSRPCTGTWKFQGPRLSLEILIELTRYDNDLCVCLINNHRSDNDYAICRFTLRRVFK